MMGIALMRRSTGLGRLATGRARDWLGAHTSLNAVGALLVLSRRVALKGALQKLSRTAQAGMQYDNILSFLSGQNFLYGTI